MIPLRYTGGSHICHHLSDLNIRNLVHLNLHIIFSYETSNSISAQEQGQLQNVGTDQEGIAVRGQYSYVGPDGVTYTVVYIADENGFQPQGAHIPH